MSVKVSGVGGFRNIHVRRRGLEKIPTIYGEYANNYFHTVPDTLSMRTDERLSIDLGEVVISGSGSYPYPNNPGGYAITKAFQHNDPTTADSGDTWWAQAESVDVHGTRWLKASYDMPKTVNGLVVKTRNYPVGTDYSGGYHQLFLQGSDDDSTWTDILAVGSAGSRHTTPILSINATYKHYRVTARETYEDTYGVARFFLLYNPTI